MEPESNVQYFCPEHAPRPMVNPGPAADYVGRYVKRAFPSTEGRAEHMWVKITGAEGTLLTGRVDNTPVLDMAIKRGDEVTFDVSEIEQVL